MQNVIEITNLKKVYTKSGVKNTRQSKIFEAIKDISFSVKQGEIFGILGPNGAGKTTTLEIIEGIQKQTSGQITVLGFDNLKNQKEIKKRIGVQLQTSQYLPFITLGELLKMFGSLYGKKVNPLDNLRAVNLESKINERVENLSGGQKQRFTIATALISDPEILFLDEPTTGLDPKARREMWQLVREINQKNVTIIITTHYMEEAEYLCDRVAIMDNGEILIINEPKSLINNLAHTTQVSFFTDKPIEDAWWKEKTAVVKIYSKHPKVILELNSLNHIAQILNTLKEHKIAFTGFTVKTATLEDVYLDLTGKELATEHTN